MITILQAKHFDFDEISDILNQLNLGYQSQGRNNFWVAKNEMKIVGIIQCLIFDNFFFIANLGVLPSYRKQGLAKNLIKTSTNSYSKDTYLYTIIPDYFRKIGFIASNIQKDLPPKNMFDCITCFPDKCTCMVKHAK